MYPGSGIGVSVQSEHVPAIRNDKKRGTSLRTIIALALNAQGSYR